MSKQGRKPGKLTEKDIRNCEKLVDELRTRVMKPKEMMQLVGIKQDSLGYGKLLRYIVFIGHDYPIYQPCPHQYAILNNLVMDEADELKRAARRYAALDREYKRND